MASLRIPGPSRQTLRLSSDRTTAAGTVIDGGIDLTKTVSELMKDVAKTMKNVPLVEGIAGIVFRLIQIRDVRPSLTYLRVKRLTFRLRRK